MNPVSTVLLLSDNPGDDYVARIKAGATSSCNGSSFSLTSVNVYSSGKLPIDVLRTSTYSGVILTPPVSDDRQILSLLEAAGKPFVRIAPLLDTERGNCVAFDEFDAASAIVSLLTANGHRRIAIMRGPNSHLVSMRRYNGYANAIGACGLRVDPALVTQGDFTRASGRELAPRLFAAKPTAIFACNDDMAAGVIDAAEAAGIRVPEDISVIGYDDNAIATKVRPQLTTVRQPCEAMGLVAGRTLVDRLKNPRLPRVYEVIPFEIVERQSVVRPGES